jgi:hypothetical protein
MTSAAQTAQEMLKSIKNGTYELENDATAEADSEDTTTATN